MSDTITRKLTTILAADAVGYSSEMERDEIGTTTALRKARSVFFQLIAKHNGRVANTAGDGLIAEFPSVVEAVTCAIEVQNELGADGSSLQYRIGLHLGDVILDGDDLLGEGVNLASRLESMADPGGILLSQQVYDHVHSKLTIGFEFIGDQRPKNYASDVPVYRVARPSSRVDDVSVFAHARRARRTAPEPRKSLAETPSAAVEPQDIASEMNAEHPNPARDTNAPQLERRAATLGILWGLLLVIDLATGSSFFAHWPMIPILAYLGYQGAPLMTDDPFMVSVLRAGVGVLALLMINLFSYNGALWFIFPAAAIIAVTLLRGLSGSRS